LEYNVYCDESCHLEHDGINVMTLGAVWCPKQMVKDINTEIISIKRKYNVQAISEIKWTKVGPIKLSLYEEIVNYFFNNTDLHFRGLIVPDKSILDHKRFSQTHDDWYYKMYFDMLKVIFSPDDSYNIYVDIKDTHSHTKTKELHQVCCNSALDFSAHIIKNIQPIRSYEVQIMQIVDILIGAIAYQNRNFPDGFEKSNAKQKLIQLIKQRSHYSLSNTTLYRESKMNLLMWESSK